MARKISSCAICENSNQASICSVCVNYRLNEYSTSLKSLRDRRDSLYSKLSEVLVRKGKADDQTNWRVLQHEKLASLREKLCHSKEQVAQGRAKIESMSADMKLTYGVLESALSTLENNRVEQLEKFYPNLICTQSLGLVAITSERLHKQSVVIKQICRLFPQRRRMENYLPNSAASFLYATDISDGKSECLIEGWDIVEHPKFPPPPSQSEDVEHWTRAMFIDAKRK